MGAFGVLVSRAHTLAEALQLWAHTHAIFNSGARIWVSVDRERAWMHQTLDPRMRAGRREAEQFRAITVLQLERGLSGATDRPLELRLRSAPIPGLREPALFAGVDVRWIFRARCSAWRSSSASERFSADSPSRARAPRARSS